MRVRAKDLGQKYSGFYNYVRRKPGDVFDLTHDKHYSSKWMEPVDRTVPKTPSPGEPTQAEIEAERKAADKKSKAGDKPTGEKEVI